MPGHGNLKLRSRISTSTRLPGTWITRPATDLTMALSNLHMARESYPLYILVHLKADFRIGFFYFFLTLNEQDQRMDGIDGEEEEEAKRKFAVHTLLLLAIA